MRVCASSQPHICDTHYCTPHGLMGARSNLILSRFSGHDMCMFIYGAHRWLLTPAACVNVFLHGCIAPGDCQGVAPPEKSTIRQRATPALGAQPAWPRWASRPDASFVCSGALRWAENGLAHKQDGQKRTNLCLQIGEMLKEDKTSPDLRVLRVGLLVQLLLRLERPIFSGASDHIPGNYTTKDRLSLSFPSKFTGVLKTLFQTRIYHVDRFGHILQQYLASCFL